MERNKNVVLRNIGNGERFKWVITDTPDMNDKELKEEIEKMKNEKKSIREITQTLNISNARYYRIMGEQPTTTEEDAEATGEEPVHDGDKKTAKKPKKPAMIDDEKVKDTLFEEFEKAAHKELLPLLKDEFVQRFKNGAILLHYDIRYRRDIEDMGYTWEEFLDFCFKAGYQLALNAHLEELEEEKANADMQNMVKAGVTMKTVEQIGKGEK